MHLTASLITFSFAAFVERGLDSMFFPLKNILPSVGMGLHNFSFIPVDIFYIFRGSTEPEHSDGVSYEVITVNLITGDVRQASDTLYATDATSAAGEASPSLEKTVGEPSPWPDLGSKPLGRCLSGRSHSSLRRKVVGAAT